MSAKFPRGGRTFFSSKSNTTLLDILCRYSYSLFLQLLFCWSTLFILNSGKQVLWQTVKTQMKCCIRHFHCSILSKSALFAKTKNITDRNTYKSSYKISTCDPSKYIMVNPYLYYQHVWKKLTRMKRIN